MADRVGDGFLIPLPYGTRVGWLQNVLAGGRATISSEGASFDVVQPQVIDAAAALPALSAPRRRMFQRVGTEHYLRVNDRPTT